MKAMNMYYGWDDLLLDAMEMLGLVWCEEGERNERQSHKYTNCMLKGLNLKCNIPAEEKKRCQPDSDEREDKRICRVFEDGNLNDRSTANLYLGCAYIFE